MDTRILTVELGLVVVVYVVAVTKQSDMHAFHPTGFVLGVVALSGALVSPLHGVAERSLTGHMIQHVVLVSVAAPLLAYGRPIELVLSVLGRRQRQSTTWTWLVVASVVQVGVLLAWHIPLFFDAAVGNTLLHELEHAMLTFTAVLVWDCLMRIEPAQLGGGVVALFVATLATMVYGVALTVARSAWYAPYRRNPLSDQQVAGVIMWAYGGLAAVVGGVALGVEWLRSWERTAPSPQHARRGST